VDRAYDSRVQLVDLTADDPRLVAFHRGIYWDAFAEQYEPIESWQRALRGEDAYRLTVRLALDGERILGGISYELYPRSGCGFLTYLVVAPHARGLGLGKGLQTAAVADLFAAGAPAVFGEINDPRTTTLEPAEVAWQRLERNQRWGARVVDTRYVQPALSPTLQRDRGLVLIALAGAAPLPAELPGAVVRSFLEDLYAVTEGGPLDSEMTVGERVRLLELARPAA
jgi:GNAT superfamily N-acetyltransferase